MMDIEVLKSLDHPRLSYREFLEAKKPLEVLKQRKAILNVTDADNEEAAIARYVDHMMVTAYKSEVIDPETVCDKLVEAAQAISPYPLKLMNANASALFILRETPPVREVPGMYSGNTTVSIKRQTYGGDARYVTYGRMLTERFECQRGLLSLDQLLTEDRPFLIRILKQTQLGDEAESLIARIEAVRRTQATSTAIDQTIKQIYFPVDKAAGKYHLLGIVNHSGLRKGVSDMMSLMRSTTLRQVKKGKKVEEYPTLRVPTITMNIGGTNPRNSGEVIMDMMGKVRMLTAYAPVYRKPRQISEARMRAVADHGNIFLLMKKLRIDLDDRANAFFSRLDAVKQTNNMHNRRATYRLFERLLLRMLQPVLDVANEVETLDRAFFDKMPSAMQKWLDGERFSGSITADDYRALADLCVLQFDRSCNLRRNKEPVMMNDIMREQLHDAVLNVLRRY